MNLSNLKPAEGSTKTRKRIGRGAGSGLGLSLIHIFERTLKLVTIIVCTARPGIIIGKGGQEVDKLKEELKKVTDKDIQINIFEVKRPELDAVIVANNIARQVEGKIAYRRAIKMAIANTMRMGAEGIKIQISGRLNGAEMARSEMYKEGRTPDVYKRQVLLLLTVQ